MKLCCAFPFTLLVVELVSECTGGQVDGAPDANDVSCLQNSLDVQSQAAASAHFVRTPEIYNSGCSDDDVSLLQKSLELQDQAQLLAKHQPKTTQAALNASVSNACDLAWCILPLLIIACVFDPIATASADGLPDAALTKRTGNHINALTGTRAPLILLIFFVHTGVIQFNVVGAFMMLSGTVLSASRLTAQGEIKAPLNSVRDVVKFILTRCLRVLPLTMCCYCMPWSHNDPRTFWSEWATKTLSTRSLLPTFFKHMTNLLSGNDLDDFWFVQSIMALYAFYPLLEWLLVYLRRNTAQWWLWCLSCCFLLKICIGVCVYRSFQQGALEQGDWYIAPQYHVCLYTFPLTWIPDFLAGMVLPYLEENRIQIPQSQVLVTCADILTVSSVFAMFVMPVNSALMVLSDFHVFAPGTALFLWSLFPGNGASLCRRVLSCDFLVRWGNYAFAFYLCQYRVLGYFDAIKMRNRGVGSYSLAYGLRFNLFEDSNTAFTFFAALLFTFVISWALHVVVERPLGQIISQMMPR